jgi:hypothetical protein
MRTDPQIFEGKSLGDLFKDIYENHKTQKTEIVSLVQEFAKLIKRPDDVVMLGPIIQQMLDTGVKNDEQLIKMANIVQRQSAAELRLTTTKDDDMLLSEDEKNRLLANAREDMIKVIHEVEEAVDTAKAKAKVHATDGK